MKSIQLFFQQEMIIDSLLQFVDEYLENESSTDTSQNFLTCLCAKHAFRTRKHQLYGLPVKAN